MAAEAHRFHQRQAYDTGNWSCPSLSSDQGDSLAMSISEILDHGSVSFGRYTAETLAWEKFSCFTHNRCQEEIEKFKAPGLVAQKKAYFEEYYKRIRALKALELEEEPVAGTEIEPFQGEQGIITQPKTGGNDDRSKVESASGNADVIQFSEKNMTDELSLSVECIVDEKEQPVHSVGSMVEVFRTDELIVPLSVTVAEHSTREATGSCAQSIEGCTDASRKGRPACNVVKHSVSQLKKQKVAARPMGPAASAAMKIKMDCRIKKAGDEPSEKRNQSFHRDVTWKDRLSSSKGVTPKPASKIKARQVSSCRKLKEGLSSDSVPYTSPIEDKMTSCPSDMRNGPVRANSTHKCSVDRLPVTVSVPARSSQTVPKELTTIGHLKTSSVNERSVGGFGMKSMELNDHRSAKSGQSETQGSKVRSAKLLTVHKSIKNVVLDLAQINSGRRGKKEKGINPNCVGLGRDLKLVSHEVSDIPRVSNSKPVHKIEPSRSVDLVQAPKVSRSDTKPSWRQRIPIWR